MKVILLVLDGLGVGAMAEVVDMRPQDQKTNTLLHVAEAVDGLNLPTLAALGLGCIQSTLGLSNVKPPLASFGRANLAYQGADSYLGHQALMGTIPTSSEFMLMNQVSDEIENILLHNGYLVRRFPEGGHTLVVDESVVIADNLEADVGQNINVTVGLAHISFDQAVEIGQLVRQVVKVARVIVFGGIGLTLNKILSHIEIRDPQIGINSPALDVYNERLMVRHLGYGVNPERQIASILANDDKQVSLIGKMADLIVCPSAYRNPAVTTEDVMSEVVRGVSEDTFDFMAATVQETDLAGHEGDTHRFAKVLRQVDDQLAKLLPLLKTDDMLIITADHGNDPTLGLGKHTREQVPTLLYSPSQHSRRFQDRLTLADIAATVSVMFDVHKPQDGVAIPLFQ